MAPKRHIGPTDFSNSTAIALANALLHERKAPLTLIQVGANYGDFDEANLHQNMSSDPVRVAMHKMLRFPRTRAILIEPNPPVYRKLAAGLRGHFSGGLVEARNVAVCPWKSGSVDFFVPDPKLIDLY